MSKVIKQKTRNKPAKPYPDFPLFPHATGRWAKKIRGKLHYFGPWDDPDGALVKYQEQRDDLYAGRVPRVRGEGLAIRDLSNHFLTHKLRLVESGELRRSTFDEYHRVCKIVVEFLRPDRLVDDIVADDFGALRQELARSIGIRELTKRIQIVRSLFKFGFDSGLIDKPLRYGPQFNRPSRKAIRRMRANGVTKLLDASQIRALIAASSQNVEAMILLGVNCGLGNTDISELPVSSIDLDKGILSFPRPKTGVARRAPLWPESVKAIRIAMKHRPVPNAVEDEGLLFITKYGRRFVRYRTSKTGNGSWIDGVAKGFDRLLRAIGAKQPGIGFYVLRHVFRTVADEVHDRAAIDRIMGHEDSRDMATHYVERIDDDRLKVVTDHVRNWLFGKKAKR